MLHLVDDHVPLTSTCVDAILYPSGGRLLCTYGDYGCNFFQCEPTTCVSTVYEELQKYK